MFAAAAKRIRDFRVGTNPSELVNEMYVRCSQNGWRCKYEHVSQWHFKAYLWRIATRAAGKILRREFSDRIVRSFDPGQAESRDHQDEELELSLKLHIDAHMHGHQRIVLLTHLETVDLEKTAAICGVQTETVKRYIRNAMPLLERWLADEP